MVFAVERIGNNKQALGDSIREALRKFAEQHAGAHFGKVASAVETMIEAFPYLNGTDLHVTVQGNVEPTGFNAVSMSIRALASDVMA